MLFTSYSFLLFVALVFITYYLTPKNYQWVTLLIASYLFYGLVDIAFLGYIMATTLSTYLITIKISKINANKKRYIKEHELTRKEKKSHKKKVKALTKKYLVVGLLFNFGLLGLTKYTNFIISNINYLLNNLNQPGGLSFITIAMPMGISFYTFKTMSYLLDVYREKHEAESNPLKLALFVSFFPQLVQGPISRFNDLSKSLFEGHAFDYIQFKHGLQRIAWGYFKKIVLADRILVAVKTLIVTPEEYQGFYVVVVMLFYTYQLYCDFTGGIDITIGIGEALGVKMVENFKQPYLSTSIKEFWRRWHITMGTWFKDYLFYPISVSSWMLNISKSSRKRFGNAVGKRIPVYISTIIVWFTTGLWHGAHWNFIVWGLMNGLVIIISFEFEPLYRLFHDKFNVKDKLYFRIFQIIRTIFLMSAIRLFDVYRNVPLTFKMFGTIFTRPNFEIFFNGSLMNIGLTLGDYVILLIGLIVLYSVSIYQRKGSFRLYLNAKPQLIRYAVYAAIFISIIVFGAYGVGYDSTQFIYNQF